MSNEQCPPCSKGDHDNCPWAAGLCPVCGELGCLTDDKTDRLFDLASKPRANRVPFEDATKQLAETLSLTEAEARQYAEQYRQKLLGKHALHSPAIRGALQLAIEAGEKAAKDRVINGRVEFNGIDITKALSGVAYASERLGVLANPRPWIALRMPANPHDRRTFRIAGKPYHFAQGKGSLRLQPGETQWA